MTRRISILGSTGSVGSSTLDLVQRNRDAFEVEALTAASNVAKLAEQARAVGAKVAVVADEARLGDLRDALGGSGIDVRAGEAALCDVAAGEADWIMAAIVGCAGLKPVMAAAEAGKMIALANKESLVAAGELMIAAAKASDATILPVDSEHNAIFQCLAGQDCNRVSRLVLTASGGPFRTKSVGEMERMTPEQAIAHPNWSMGAKISVDSATLMNKGLEVIEAHHLFGLPSDRIDIVVHPQSVIHSLVEYADGSMLAQLGAPDMRVPIAHALAWPERMETPCERLDLASVARLDFEAPDADRFPALRLAREALEAGGSAPATLNAANEIAVAAFLDRKIGFRDIASTVERLLNTNEAAPPRSIDDVLTIDFEARATARDLLVAA